MRPLINTAAELAAIYQQAFRLHQREQVSEAQELYRRILQCQPDHADALHMLGMAAIQDGDAQSGIELIRRSLQVHPGQALAYSTLGNAYRSLNRPQEALDQYELCLKLDPRHAAALNNRGSALLDLGRYADAVDSYQRALDIKPNHAGTLFNHGNALMRLGRTEDALRSYDQAVLVKSDFAPALFARATALRELRRFDEALLTLDYYVALKPASAEAHHDRGSVLHELQRLPEAIANYDCAIRLDAKCATAHFNRAVALAELNDFQAAALAYAKVLEIVPDFPFALGGVVQSKSMSCDWSQWQQTRLRVADAVNQGRAAIIPFALLAVSDSPETQLQCAQTFVGSSFPAAKPLWNGECYAHDRLRVAYISADFKEHPVSLLLAGVLERHDRRRFEVIAVALRPADDSALGRRVRTAVGRWLDVSRMDDAAVARLLRRLEVDIIVDLQGFTQGTRAGILAHRAAPVQVNYLGFPATMGAPYIDYIIGDDTVIPHGDEGFYSERIVRLPHCYLPFDQDNAIAVNAPTRVDAGLPAEGLVFCAFNNHYKISPPLFDIWMRLLAATPASCLWLREASPVVMDNLRREASARGVAADRLVFAQRIDALERHLARHRLADIFLDTVPYGAHATAAVALWAGLPVVSCAGTAFAGRVAASLLRSLDMPQLIAPDLAGYESLALALAHDPAKLSAVRAELALKRTGAPLFDTPQYTLALEAAFLEMRRRQRRGHAPSNFTVAAIEQSRL